VNEVCYALSIFRLGHRPIPWSAAQIARLFLPGNAASQVNATVTLRDGAASEDYAAAAYHNRPVRLEVQVVFMQGGNEIYGSDLAHNETITCNGTGLAPDHSMRYTFWGMVPDAPTMSCSYSRDGTTAQFTVTEPQRLSVTAPAPHADLPRGHSLVVQFAPALSDPQEHLTAFIQREADQEQQSAEVTAQAGSATVTIPDNPATDNNLLDFTGPVLLNVTRSSPLSLPPSGFHSLTGSFVDGVQVPLQVG
jgi:hypothetical protein